MGEACLPDPDNGIGQAWRAWAAPRLVYVCPQVATKSGYLTLCWSHVADPRLDAPATYPALCWVLGGAQYSPITPAARASPRTTAKVDGRNANRTSGACLVTSR